jgi:hypothetical protein
VLTIFKSMVIMLWGLKDRTLKVLLELLVWIDITVGLIIAIPFYLIFSIPVPDATVTISAVVGTYSMKGYRWAKVCEVIIDTIFHPLDGPDHCRRNADKTNYED